MRTRYRNIALESTPAQPNQNYSALTSLCNGSSVVYGPVPYGTVPYRIVKGLEERIHDETGRSVPHFVRHRKMEYDITMARQGSYYQPYNASPFGITSYSPAIINQLQAEYYAGLQLAQINTWDLGPNMSPGLPTGWSMSIPSFNETVIINDLIERANQLKADVLLNLVEANQIWPSLKSLSTALPNMARSWNKIRKLIRTSSGSYLAWKFGISPLLSDLSAIAKFAPDMKRQFDRYVNQEPSRYSKFVPGNLSFSKAGSTTYANGRAVDVQSYQGLATSQPGYRYVLVAKPTAHYSSKFFQEFDFAMRRFSSSPASLAWERIPFSFVADWFVDIRGALSAIDRSLGFKPYEIVSLTRSFGYSMSTMAFRDFNSPCNGAKVGLGHVATCTFKHYERSVLPMPGLFPAWKGRFGKSQAGITAALIGQKLSQLPSKR